MSLGFISIPSVIRALEPQCVLGTVLRVLMFSNSSYRSYSLLPLSLFWF